MLRENWKFVSRVERISDIIVILLLFYFSYYIRSLVPQLEDLTGWQVPLAGSKLLPIRRYTIVPVVAVFSYSITLQALGAYGSMRMSSFWKLLRIFSTASIVSFFAIGASLYLTKSDQISRSLVAFFCFALVWGLTLERYFVLMLLRYFRRKGFNYRSLIIVGVGKQAVKIVSEITKQPELGLRIRGFIDLRTQERFLPVQISDFKRQLREVGCNNIGKIHFGIFALENLLKHHAVDEVIFTDVADTLQLVEDAIFLCSEQGVRTTIAADFFSSGIIKSGISYFGNTPLIHYQTPPGERADLAVKRFIDIFLSSILILFLFPFFILIAIAIKLDSRGPVLFFQKRVGLNGRLFDLIKFRSMKLNAEDELQKLQEQNEVSGPAFKMSNDPRVTRVGKFLRKYSLDELPQLWNVLNGSMSLVGPRPPVPSEVRIYERRYRRRLSMRPGITCIWQVSGRSDIKDFETWVKLDLEYIDNWNLWLDFRLLLKTVPAVILGEGAR